MEEKQIVYEWEDAVKFIHERCNLSEDMIIEVLELEEEYMKSIGIILEENIEYSDLQRKDCSCTVDGKQRTNLNR